MQDVILLNFKFKKKKTRAFKKIKKKITKFDFTYNNKKRYEKSIIYPTYHSLF